MPTFVASRLAADVLFPDRVDVDGTKIVYYKGSLIGYSSIVVQRVNIASVKINSHILFADIVIETSGGRNLILHGFLKSDAKALFNILQT